MARISAFQAEDPGSNPGRCRSNKYERELNLYKKSYLPFSI